MKRIGMVWIILALVFTLAACGQAGDNAGMEGATSGNQESPASADAGQKESSDNGGSDASSDTESSESPEELATAYPITVKDAAGAELTFEQTPKRIVSLLPSETEILFALGLEDRIVGVTEWCNYPEAAKDKPKVGGLNANVEAVIEANPELIVGGSFIAEETHQKLTSLDMKVFRSNAQSIDEVYDHILELGRITDTLARAQEVVAEMKREQERVLEAMSDLKPEDKKKVYIEFSPGYTVGSGEFMHELLVQAGGINVAAESEGWIQISEEKIIQDNPDVILYSAGVENLRSLILGRPGWDEINAIRNDRLEPLNDDIVSRPGPRITEGLALIAEAIYPERMK